jgi:hypothetical protein
MAAINVYRYDYYDPVLKHERRSVDYATGDAIMAMGGKILSDTQQSVEEELLEDDGTIRAAHVWMEAPLPRPALRGRAAKGIPGH